MEETFDAGQKHVGEICFLCEEKIKAEELVRYYGGPYIMHAKCVDKLINH